MADGDTLPQRIFVGELTGRRRERKVLDGLVDSVRDGRSRVLMVHGEPGVGKTVLLGYVAEHATACHVARTAGVQSEMELPFAGLHQLMIPMLDRLRCLPGPQRDAVRTAFGIVAGPAPDGFLVGLAVLGLFSELAEQRPLICLVDDEQWLDRASSQVLGFVARRLEAVSVGLVFAARTPSAQMTGLPELAVDGLPDVDAYALLDSVLAAPLDPRVRDRIVADTRGNPLALLEVLRDLTPAELAGGFGLPAGVRPLGSMEETFGRRLDVLPAQTQRLMRLAAADPLGNPALVWQAAQRLGIPVDAATPAAEAGLLDINTRVQFRHPLVRSAAYRSASIMQKQEAHRALAEATDPLLDPDRHAWHRAHAAQGPDEDVADELERSAGRAQARGGLAAAAAFLKRAAVLTPDPARRVRRLLAAARTMRDGGAPDAALALLVEVEAQPLDALRSAEAEHLRGQIAFDQGRAGDAVLLLLNAARRFAPLNAEVARETYLEALGAAIWAGDLDGPGGLREVATAARGAPSGPQPPRTVDVVLDAFAVRFTDGHAAAAPLFAQAVEPYSTLDLSGDGGRWLCSPIPVSDFIALELWDADCWHSLAARQARFAHDTGALVYRQYVLNFLAFTHLVFGEFATAASMIDEERLIAEATGNPSLGYVEMVLAAWRGQDVRVSTLIEAIAQEAIATGLGRVVAFVNYGASLLYNGLGRHDLALDAAQRAFESLEMEDAALGPLIVPELAEAASRTGDVALVKAASVWLSERARVSPTRWARGIEARIRALHSEGDAADTLYRESIAYLDQTRLRTELARTHLIYGEWLRRENRRAGARVQLRRAHEMFTAVGADGFVDRARRELLATGGTVRERGAAVHHGLTAQEAQVARLARDGLSNPQIGARLFISPRTVQYHLSKVFTKLDIGSRSQLGRVLPSDPDITLQE
jgi:DNA-binding CsgD family transcriptional regulator/tetratricopeptide (TPR) repeat protein